MDFIMQAAEPFLNPIILFFCVGVLAGVVKCELKLPSALYEVLSIYLLITIGMKGGLQLAQTSITAVGTPVLTTIILCIGITVSGFYFLVRVGKVSVADSAAIAVQSGSVSAVTFAVGMSFLQTKGVEFEPFMTLLLAVAEIPAIIVGILLYNTMKESEDLHLKKLLHEVFLGKGVYLLLSGLFIGFFAGPERVKLLGDTYFDLFKVALAFFLLEMGLLVSGRLKDVKLLRPLLIGFSIGMPLVAGTVSIAVGLFIGLSTGGAALLGILMASASFIAAPAALRISVPEANPAIYLTMSLGITFTFNVTIGMTIFYLIANFLSKL